MFISLKRKFRAFFYLKNCINFVENSFSIQFNGILLQHFKKTQSAMDDYYSEKLV